MPDQPAFLTRFCAIRATARSVSFTIFESGNIPATSGSSTTTLPPSANLFAYFPRTPLLKSYSARISDPAVFFLGFFISLPLARRNRMCVDNSDFRWRPEKLTINYPCKSRQYFYFSYFLHYRRMNHMIEIPSKLQGKPKLRLHPKQLLQTESSIWSHAPLPMD